MQVIKAGENHVLTQIIGDLWGTHRATACFTQVANSCDGRGRDVSHGSAPLECALAPGVCQGDQQNRNENESLDEGKHSESVESDGPGI